MDEDRKYRQHGYMDGDGRASNGAKRDERQTPKARLPLDVTGPRLPRLLQTVVAARCYNCGTALPADIDFKGNCPKCGAALHCCKQCAHFEPSTRFQCLKPVAARIPVKDAANECELFKSRVTVARDATASGPTASSSRQQMPAPRTPNDARAAFDSLFKK